MPCRMCAVQMVNFSQPLRKPTSTGVRASCSGGKPLKSDSDQPDRLEDKQERSR